MGNVRPQDGINDNYFLRKPIKEESLKNVILEIVQLWLSKSCKRRHSVSDIPSSRFIVSSTLLLICLLFYFEFLKRPAMRQPTMPSLGEEDETPAAELKILVAEGTLH